MVKKASSTTKSSQQSPTGVVVVFVLGITFLITTIYVYIGGRLLYQRNTFRKHPIETAKPTASYLDAIRFDQVIRKVIEQVIGSPSTPNQGTASKQDILNYINESVLTGKDDMNSVASKLVDMIGKTISKKNPPFPYNLTSERNKEFEKFYPSSRYSSENIQIINRLLFELLYDDYQSIYDAFGKCYESVTDVFPSDLKGLYKPLIIQPWINTFSGMKDDTTMNGIWIRYVSMVSNTYCDMIHKVPTDISSVLWVVLLCPFLLILLLPVFTIMNIFSIRPPRSGSGDTGSSIGLFFASLFSAFVFLYYILAYTNDIFSLTTWNLTGALDTKVNMNAGYTVIYGFVSFVNDIGTVLNTLGKEKFKLVVPLVFLILGLIFTFTASNNPAVPTISGSIIGAITVVFIIVLSIYKKPMESCENGWVSNDPTVDCNTRPVEPLPVSGIDTYKTMTFTQPMINDDGFRLYPAIPSSLIVKFSVSQRADYRVIRLLPSPMPKWITFIDPIYKHQVSRNIPFLLSKLQVLFSGLQKVIQKYNQGTMLINREIAHLDNSIRVTVIPSPITINSDMQIRQLINLLINMMNLYLVTHWYLRAQTELTTFIFNVRNNVLALDDMISVSSDLDIASVNDFDKSYINNVMALMDGMLTTELEASPIPIVLPTSVYESIPALSMVPNSPITERMPWLLPSVRRLHNELYQLQDKLRYGEKPSPTFWVDWNKEFQSEPAVTLDEVNDYYFDLSMHTIFTLINQYLMDYINNYLITAQSELTDTQDIVVQDTSIFSFSVANVFFLINIRLRYVYDELIVKYYKQYSPEVINNIRYQLSHIVDKYDGTTVSALKNPETMPTPISTRPSDAVFVDLDTSRVDTLLNDHPTTPNVTNTKTMVTNMRDIVRRLHEFAKDPVMLNKNRDEYTTLITQLKDQSDQLKTLLVDGIAKNNPTNSVEILNEIQNYNTYLLDTVIKPYETLGSPAPGVP